MESSAPVGNVVRVLYPPDSRQMLELLQPALLAAPYSCPMDDAAVQRSCFAPDPPGVYEVRWLGHQVFGVLRDERLLGFIDVGLGYDQANLHLMGEPPLGLLRFIGLPPAYTLAARVARLLLAEAEKYWRQAGVKRIRAFAPSTGYPAFQCGAGVLPETWEDLLRWLNEAGYRLTERFYCLRYPLGRQAVETLASGDFSLWPQLEGDERYYQLFDDEHRVAIARFLVRRILTPTTAGPIAYLSDFEVAPPWQRQGIGRWLLRRIINDSHLLGCTELVLHVGHAAQAALSLLRSQGFEEIDYRGYTLEKRL